MRRNICRVSVLSVVLVFCGGAVWGISTSRSGNIFSADEGVMVVNTTVSGTANWTLTNNYGETITGSSPVSNGRISIPIQGLLYDTYQISIAGDGTITGAIVPPLIELHPSLNSNSAALYEARVAHTADALMWKQIGCLQFRFEGGLGFNQTELNFINALRQQGVRAAFKLHLSAPPSNYDTFEQQCRNFISQVYPLGVESFYCINEPDGCGWWSGCWNEYWLVQERFYRAMKAVAPDAIMYAPETAVTIDPAWIDRCLQPGFQDVFSAHYPSDGHSREVHIGTYYTRMRKTGRFYPAINGEAMDMNDNFNQSDWAKFYPGYVPAGVGMCFDVTTIGHLDLGMHLQDHLHLDMYPNAPFAVWSANNLVPSYQCLQMRFGNDEAAGVQFRKRMPDWPLHFLGWMLRRGSDYFLVAYCAVGRMTQLLEITTASPELLVRDGFGNEYPARASNGKVYVLVGNPAVAVHGMTAQDTVRYVQRTGNLPPEIADPGPQTATVGVPFRLRMRGRDPDMVLTPAPNLRMPTWSIVSGPSGMSITSRAGVITWTPAAAGQVTVTVRLTDPDGASAQQTFTVNVQPSGGNLNPVFLSRPAPAAALGLLFKYPARAYDPNGDPMSYELVQGPAGMLCSPTGYVTWTPQTAGTYTFSVRVSDGRGGITEASHELVVIADLNKPSQGLSAPAFSLKEPTDLTVVGTSNGVTLVWNMHTFADAVIERATSRQGPWSEIGSKAVPATWFRDEHPPTGPVFYRVRSRNREGVSLPTDPVNGRNMVPIAEAGRNVKIASPGTVNLDGSASFDPDRTGPLTYQWYVVTAPLGASASISNPTSATTAVNVSQQGKYVIGLTVSDGEEVSRPDYLWIVVGGDGGVVSRVCHITPTPFGVAGATVSLSAWGSPYPSGRSSWHWRIDYSPVYEYPHLRNRWEIDGEVLTNSFVPDIPGVYYVQAKCNDDWMSGYPDMTRVIVTPAIAASTDTVPPSAVNDLAAGNPTDTSMRLTWTAPGNDGTVGTAAQYDIRYSPTAITNDATFSAAVQCVGEPAPQAAGSSQNFTVSGLTPGTRYWFALKTVDGAGNWSALSNVTTGQTTGTAPSVPPVVSLTSPVNGSTYTAPATVALTATATDSDGSITRVEFWTGTTQLNADSTSPYSYTWTGVAAGSYALRAIAYDNTNTTSTSAVVNITVNPPPNQPPTVTMTSPVNGSTYTAPATLNLAATANDPDGSIANVRFYRGTTLLNTDNASPYEYAWTNVSSGTYQLRAVAQDNQGATSTSTVVTVTVLSSSTPPVWYSLTATANPANGGTISPASGTYLAGSQIQVTATPNTSYTFANWSGDITGTSPTITLTMDSSKTLTANFTYTPPVNSSPSVTIIHPADGTTYTAPADITITATAADSDGTIAAVRFYHGMTQLWSDSTSPYEYTWAGVAAGTYVLTAQAEDDGGAVGTSAGVVITVNPGTQPPQPQPVLQPGEVRVIGSAEGYINATQNPNVAIRFRRTAAGMVTVRIYDLRGRLVMERSKDGQAGIDDDIAWNAADLPAGVYIAKIKGAGIDGSKRIALAK